MLGSSMHHDSPTYQTTYVNGVPTNASSSQMNDGGSIGAFFVILFAAIILGFFVYTLIRIFKKKSSTTRSSRNYSL